MDNYSKVELLAKVLAGGNIQPIEKYIGTNCVYNSSYGRKHFSSAKDIIDSIYEVQKKRREDDYTYLEGYQMINICDILRENVTIDDLQANSKYKLSDNAFLMFDYSEKYPTCVVICYFESDGYFADIELSRNREWFDIVFYSNNGKDDSYKDIPKLYDNNVDSDIYIWPKAAERFRTILSNDGYNIDEKEAFDDCIGYHCTKDDNDYTFYMFADGLEERTYINADYCAQMLERPYSKGIVLIAYFEVNRMFYGENVKYKIGPCENIDGSLEYRHPCVIDGKNTLLFYPATDMLNLIDMLVYAFNNKDLDIYKCILTHDNPEFEGGYNSAVYYKMLNEYEKYGKMKIGYMSYNDKVYSTVPYVEGHAFFSFSVNKDRKIDHIEAHPFKTASSFVPDDERKEKDYHYPKIHSLEVLPKRFSHRFIIKAVFDNKEVKLYTLPIDEHNNKTSEVVSFDHHVFTDEIWKSARLIEKPKSEYEGYKGFEQGVIFKNDYVISSAQIYFDGIEYQKIARNNSISYENDEFCVKKCFEFKGEEIYAVDEDNMIFCVNNDTYLKIDGSLVPAERRFKDDDYDEEDRWDEEWIEYEGLDEKLISESTTEIEWEIDDDFGNFGFKNMAGDFVIEPQYAYAHEFTCGLAAVNLNRTWYRSPEGKRYYENHFGYINGRGETVIPFAYDEAWPFNKYGVAVVENKEGYGMLIDLEGNTVPGTENLCIEHYYSYEDRFLEYTYSDSNYNPDSPVGIYDTKKRRILVEPFIDYFTEWKEDIIEVHLKDGETSDFGMSKYYIDSNGEVLYKWLCNKGFDTVDRTNSRSFAIVSAQKDTELKSDSTYYRPNKVSKSMKVRCYGVYSSSDEYLIPMEYENVWELMDNVFACEKDGVITVYNIIAKQYLRCEDD